MYRYDVNYKSLKATVSGYDETETEPARIIGVFSLIKIQIDTARVCDIIDAIIIIIIIIVIIINTIFTVVHITITTRSFYLRSVPSVENLNYAHTLTL